MKASTARSTTRIRVVLGCSIILVVIAAFRQVVGAQPQPRPLITEEVSDTKLVTLAGQHASGSERTERSRAGR